MCMKRYSSLNPCVAVLYVNYHFAVIRNCIMNMHMTQVKPLNTTFMNTCTKINFYISILFCILYSVAYNYLSALDVFQYN